MASCVRSSRYCASPVSPTWRARSITSSNPSATISSAATRPAKASRRISWPSFPLAERATHALGVVVWPMVEFEADDAIAAAAHRWRDAPELEQIVLCTPDKDMAQCVRGTRIVCLDRRPRRFDDAGVIEKFGVPPASIPDWLALVGDSADGYPGVPRWGSKSAARSWRTTGTSSRSRIANRNGE